MAFGVSSDEGDGDEWPVILEKYPLYNKVAGVVVTGNEDGAHAAAETTLFNMTHLGCTVPPNADTYWVGKANPIPAEGNTFDEETQHGRLHIG